MDMDLLADKINFLDSVAVLLNEAFPGYDFGNSNVSSFHGNKNEQCNVYQEIGNWRLSISTSAKSPSQSLAVELCLPQKYRVPHVSAREQERSVEKYNMWIAKVNALGVKQKLGEANHLVIYDDEVRNEHSLYNDQYTGSVLSTSRGETKLTKTGDSGPYIRLTKYRGRCNINEIVGIVDDAITLVNILNSLD